MPPAKMTAYRAFGITLSSDMPLPALPEASSENIQVTIKRAVINKRGLTKPRVARPFSQLADNNLWFHVPGIAWFCVSNGNCVQYEGEPDADDESIRLYLLGTCMGAIMHQRAHLVIHGNAVRVGDGCVVFAGNASNGKSTLAAGFKQRGYEILADDLAVIDESCKLQPSYPQIKLWRDTTVKLNIDYSTLQPIRNQIEKYAYPLADGFCQQSLSVNAIYILSTHNKKGFELQDYKGTQKFTPLKQQTYRLNHIEGLGLTAQHLRHCAKLADHAVLKQLTRPNSGFELDGLIAHIENDLQQLGIAA